MKIYAIGDLHLSGKPPSKPMEIFGKHWTDHAAKVAANWHQLIRSDDTVIICGSRGWLLPSSDNFNADDAAIYRREGLRLEASLEAARQAGYSDIIAALHYPPLYDAANESVFAELLERYGVRHCVFGHIHGSDASMVFEGIRNGITYKLVSCDTQGFTPQLVK